LSFRLFYERTPGPLAAASVLLESLGGGAPADAIRRVILMSNGFSGRHPKIFTHRRPCRQIRSSGWRATTIKLKKLFWSWLNRAAWISGPVL